MNEEKHYGLGSFVELNGTPFYKITKAELLKPFFIQVASASDIWIFLSSKGGLTAGRKNADFNLFPYETDDRLHGNYDTGSRTYIKVGDLLWQPFANPMSHGYRVTQNIYKSYYGNAVIMEEINFDLQIAYSYTYQSSEKYGFVKTSKIENLATAKRNIEVLDGLMNILPHGVDPNLQANASTLVDAYKAAELVGDNLGVYSLTTKVNDTPNPIEILMANTAFHTLGKGNVYLSPEAIPHFLDGKLSELSADCYGKKSAYFLNYTHELLEKESHSYSFVLDSGFDHTALQVRLSYVAQGDFSTLYDDIENGTKELKEIVSASDGVQETADTVATAHHYLNTLYNVMRGGTFQDGYKFDSDDFLRFAKNRNQKITISDAETTAIKKATTIDELKNACANSDDLTRLALEYLPLTFSRRHGDPSRPWNRFNINVKNDKGEKVTSYEGNWRDIFQNWEALGLSYPAYYENMVAKFVNATTADGFNPYRINQDGIDWEKPEEDNPFGGYGYWGDHQIVYLHRLLLGLERHFPTKLQEMLSRTIFTYANVPYVLNAYDEILKNSKDTITFDFAKDEKIMALVDEIGSDGKLLLTKNNAVYTVCLAEKLLVPLLSKASNLLVGGGIWMNTQRPEWNDANNAIVGIGLSMVTVYHVKAYLSFLETLFAGTENTAFSISLGVSDWLKETAGAFEKYENDYTGKEKELLDTLGQQFSVYRKNVYANGLSEKAEVSVSDILHCIKKITTAIDFTITKNAGQHGVYATYNLLHSDFSVGAMSPMLEGQSAIIGSGMLGADAVCQLLKGMEETLYQPKLRCHTLYPITMTKKFVEKNILANIKEEIEGITVKDSQGNFHFHHDIVTSEILKERGNALALPEAKMKELLAEYELAFAHNAFTGRSQVMYKFEGIGCVYWHQNAKLALAVLETVQRTREKGEDATEIYMAYKQLMSGFIYRKTPEECNAIPVEPYSHTSFSGQSEQAGMTGQVKESVIMRRIEMGIVVKSGEIHFDKWFIPEGEFDQNGICHSSLYSIPVTYQKDASVADSIKITFADGKEETIASHVIPADLSEQIFFRSTKLKKITFTFS